MNETIKLLVCLVAVIVLAVIGIRDMKKKNGITAKAIICFPWILPIGGYGIYLVIKLLGI